MASIKFIVQKKDIPNLQQSTDHYLLLLNWQKNVEDIFQRQLIEYLDRFRLMNEHQFGFRENFLPL